MQGFKRPVNVNVNWGTKLNEHNSSVRFSSHRRDTRLEVTTLFTTTAPIHLQNCTIYFAVKCTQFNRLTAINNAMSEGIAFLPSFLQPL
jgi:hypothetical protein